MQFMVKEKDMQSRSFDDNIFVIHISSTKNFDHQRK